MEKRTTVTIPVKIDVDRSELDDALRKARKLVRLLKEAKSVLSDLTSLQGTRESELKVQR